MIVEFVGASGSGKTALARSVVRSLGAHVEVALASDLVLRRLCLGRVDGPTFRNVLADLSAGIELLGLDREQRTFLRYALRRLRRHRPRSFQTLNYVRSVVRRLGMDRIARRRGRHMIVLADEGILLIAYLLFVYGNTGFDAGDLAEFVSIAPLPDHVVHVKAPVDSLLERTLSRPDPPRELRRRDDDAVRSYLRDADVMFDELVATRALRDRVLEVENLGGSQRREALADRIAGSLLGWCRTAGGVPRPRAAQASGEEI